MTCLSFLEIVESKAKSHDLIIMGGYAFCVDKHARVRRAFKETEDKANFEEVDMKTCQNVMNVCIFHQQAFAEPKDLTQST